MTYQEVIITIKSNMFHTYYLMIVVNQQISHSNFANANTNNITN